MDGTIGYLETLREDLLDAGMREHRRGGRATWGHWLRDRFSVRWLVAAATAITLLAAGSVGLLVARDGVAERERAVGGARSRAPPVRPELWMPPACSEGSNRRVSCRRRHQVATPARRGCYRVRSTASPG